jgi:hypothetical protein
MIPRRCFFGLFVSLSIALLNAHAAPPDVSGSWKWTFDRGGDPREISMKLQQDGGKVAGTITGPDGNSVDIREGKIADDGKIAFVLHIERDGSTMKVNFEGIAKSDTITGKTKYVNPQGENREREWVAKREARKSAGPDLGGEWKSVFTRQDGSPMASTLHLKHAGDMLTGKNVSGNGSEVEIKEGRLDGNEVTFKVVRERDGRTVTAKYRGRIVDGNTIKGQVESDWSGEARKMDWEATKN